MRRMTSQSFWLAAAALLTPLAACTSTSSEPPAPPPPPTAQACPETRDWEAWINAMPGPDAQPALIVTGNANIPAGMVATLAAGPLDRMMPPGQRVALSLAPGSGPSGWQPVRLEIRPAQSAYSMVLIGCDGKEIGRVDDVKTVH